MAFKALIILSVVMYASAGYLEAPAASYATYAAAPVVHSAPVAIHAPAYGSSSQNIVRSFGGTVSQYAKAVDTPFSSVRKHDTRITNNLYTPGYATYPTASYHAAAYPTAAYHAAGYAPAAYHATGYAPAATVAHVSFDGLGAHYAW